MERELKFRAWDKSRSEMYIPHTIHINPITKSFGGMRFNGDFMEDSILMQFTGLKDKNEKEIYEGDIALVTAPDTYGSQKRIAIEFKDGAYLIEWGNMFYDGADITTINWAMVFDFQFEVIGNIYENPELLNP